MGTLRVALAQLPNRVGDLDGNVERIGAAMDWAEDEAGADVLVLPELVLTGYGLADLVLSEAFVEDSREALETLAARSRRTTTVVSTIDRVPPRRSWDSRDRSVAIGAALICDGQIRGMYHKVFLPLYDLFLEARNFAPGDDPGRVWRIGEVIAGVGICEDLWGSDGPPEAQAAAGAQILFAPNASPFHRGKAAGRLANTREVGDPQRRCRSSTSTSPARRTSSSSTAGRSSSAPTASCSRGPRSSPRSGSSSTCRSPRPAGRGPGAPAHRAHPTAAARGHAARAGAARRARRRRHGVERARGGDPLLGRAQRHRRRRGRPLGRRGLGDHRGARRRRARPRRRPRRLAARSRHAARRARGRPRARAHAGDRARRGAARGRPRGRRLPPRPSRGPAPRRGAARPRRRPQPATCSPPATRPRSRSASRRRFGDLLGHYAPLRDCTKTLLAELAEWRDPDGVVFPPRTFSRQSTAHRTTMLDQFPYEVLDDVVQRYVEHGQDLDTMVAAGHDPDVAEEIIRRIDASEVVRRSTPPGPKVTSRSFGHDRQMPLFSDWQPHLHGGPTPPVAPGPELAELAILDGVEDGTGIEAAKRPKPPARRADLYPRRTERKGTTWQTRFKGPWRWSPAPPPASARRPPARSPRRARRSPSPRGARTGSTSSSRRSRATAAPRWRSRPT